MKIPCKNCLKCFNAKPSRIKKFKVAFCSRKCLGEYGKSKRMVVCHNCSKSFLNVKGGGKDRKYCCHPCYISHHKWKYGPENDKYVDGQSSYRRIAEENFRKRCFICKLSKKIEVHHIDGDRSNQNISNLCFLCRKCHKDTHWGKTILSCFLPLKERESVYQPPFQCPQD